jgi:hypothetical protein
VKALLLDALRDLRARRASTVIAVVGLTIALSASLLVALFALALAAPDPDVADPRRTIMLDFKGNPPGAPSPWFARAPVAFGPLLKARHAPLDLVSRVIEGGMEFPSGDRLHPAILLAVDPDIVEGLNLQALAGDLRATLSRLDTLAISAELMHVLWGGVAPADAIGRRVESHGRWYTVTAVLPDLDPRNPLYGASPLVGRAMAMANIDSPANEMSPGDRDWIYRMTGKVFARLRPGTSIDQVGGWMRDAFVSSPRFKEIPPAWRDHREAAYFRGVAIADLPFDGPANEMRWRALAAVGAANMLLLMLAAFNTLSLQAAHMLQRQRETALRRSLGAAAPHLVQLWAVEALLPLALSAGFAALLAWWVAPAVADWACLPPELPLADPLPPAALAGLAAAVLALLPLVIALPAVSALRRAPATALQGRTASEGPWGRRVRQFLLGVQFGGALLLLSLAGVLSLQQHHMLHADRGYQTHNRLILQMETDPDRLPPLEAFANALTHDPAIAHWSYSYAAPVVDVDNISSRELLASADGHVAEVRISAVGASLFDTYGMTVLAGKPEWSEGGAHIVVDAQTARLLGFPTPQAAVGALIKGGGGWVQQGNEPRRIVAVIKDVSLESARSPRMPQAFWLTGTPQWVVSATGPDAAALRAALEGDWKRYGLKVPYELQWADDQLADVYKQEAQMTATVAAVSLMAVVVAMLGAYAMVADTLRRRRTELVLRRLHGAGDAAIAGQVVLEFGVPLLGALLVALPLAGWLGGIYLSGFQDRVAPWAGLGGSLAAALAAMLAVTALACLRHVRLALALQPVEALA